MQIFAIISRNLGFMGHGAMALAQGQVGGDGHRAHRLPSASEIV
jgi:hypothetical protein